MAAARKLIYLALVAATLFANTFTLAAPFDLASPDSLSNSPTNNNTVHTLVERGGCFEPRGSSIGNPNLCYCYNKGHGVDRADMIDAVSEACLTFSNGIWGVSGGMSEDWFGYWYDFLANGQPDPDNVILIKLAWTGADPSCQPQNMPYYTCWNAFHEPIDDCETNTVNGKKGAWSYDPCFEYTVDPNPSKNNPSIALTPPIVT